ncbi:MAG: single-stranded DNA-binding protein [Actinomycetota bacterium]
MTTAVTITGNVTREPELRYTPTGLAVAKFGIAVNRSFTDKAGDKVEPAGPHATPRPHDPRNDARGPWSAQFPPIQAPRSRTQSRKRPTQARLRHELWPCPLSHRPSGAVSTGVQLRRPCS